jgi:hypothetical protein
MKNSASEEISTDTGRGNLGRLAEADEAESI